MDELTIYGKMFCITGNLETFSKRKEAFNEIESRGGFTQAKLTNSCDYLVVGNKGSSNWREPLGGTKIVKAQKSGIPILTENEFNNILEDLPVIPEDERPTSPTGPVRVVRSARSSIIKKIYRNWTVETNIDLDNLPTTNFILRLTYSIKDTVDRENIVHDQLEQFNDDYLIFESPSFKGFNTSSIVPDLSLDMEPTGIYAGVFKVVKFKDAPENFKARIMDLYDFIEKQDHENYRKLWIRIYTEGSAYYNRWNERFIEAKENK